MLMMAMMGLVVIGVVRAMKMVMMVLLLLRIESAGCGGLCAGDRGHCAPAKTSTTRTGAGIGNKAHVAAWAEPGRANLVCRRRRGTAGTSSHARCGGSRQAISW